MPDFHPAPFDDFTTELRDPWPVVEQLRLALNEARRYCLGAENITGHCIEELLDRLPDEDGERRQPSPMPPPGHSVSTTIDGVPVDRMLRASTLAHDHAWIHVDVENYLLDNPPYGFKIDPSILPAVAAEIAGSFDSTAVYDQIDALYLAALRKRLIDPSNPAQADQQP